MHFRIEALQMVKEKYFDYIFLDIEMPIRSGLLTCADIVKYYEENEDFQSAFERSNFVKNRRVLHGSKIETNPNLEEIDDTFPSIIGLSSHPPDKITKECWDVGFSYYGKIIRINFLIVMKPLTIKILKDIFG